MSLIACRFECFRDVPTQQDFKTTLKLEVAIYSHNFCKVHRLYIPVFCGGFDNENRQVLVTVIASQKNEPVSPLITLTILLEITALQFSHRKRANVIITSQGRRRNTGSRVFTTMTYCLCDSNTSTRHYYVYTRIERCGTVVCVVHHPPVI